MKAMLKTQCDRCKGERIVDFDDEPSEVEAALKYEATLIGAAGKNLCKNCITALNDVRDLASAASEKIMADFWAGGVA